MMSAFGVDDGTVSKVRQTVPDSLSPLLPGSTIKAYDNSRRNKKKAAAVATGARLGGTAVGAGLGVAALSAATRGKSLKFLKRPSQLKTPSIKGKQKVATITPEQKKAWAQTVVAGTGSGALGTYGGNLALKRIKRNRKEYGYRT